MSSNVSYQQLKDYSLFKDLTKVNDVMILKQILPMVVKKVSLDPEKQSHAKNNMIYIPEDHYQTTLDSQNIEQLSTIRHQQNNKRKFFMIETKIYNILKFVFYKKIDCMENMKNFEKLNFFYRSNLDQIPFGSYIYRKYDEITHIYYLVKGEIQISKSIDEKQINVTTIHQGTFFGIYEFDQCKTKRILNACSSSNGTIVVGIALDLLSQLFGKDQNQVLERLLTLNSQISKIKNQQQKKLLSSTTKIKKSGFIKAYDFHRRLMKFSDEHKIAKKDPVFGKYIQNKSLIYKIKDSNDSFPKEGKQSSNTFANFHKNKQTAKYSNRLNQHRMLTMGPFTKNSQQSRLQTKKLSFSKQSQLLSSSLKNRFNLSKRNFSMTGFDSIQTSRKSQIL